VCGIIGYVGRELVVPLLLDGLARLEYRGYDSAGIAVIAGDRILRHRQAGKVAALGAAIGETPCAATVGIGHTRWATHGAPSEENAHPHVDCRGRIAIIHNGIIENYRPLKEALLRDGHQFRSETDSEVLAHLIESQDGRDLPSAVAAAVSQAEGAFALAVLSLDHPGTIVVARRGSPLVIGRGASGTFVSSDIPALLGRATHVQFLDDDEVAELSEDGYRITTLDGRNVDRPEHQVTADPVSIQKGGYKHFMLKEIHEQARSVGETVREKASKTEDLVRLADLDPVTSGIEDVVLIACGTAYHAALVAEYLWEEHLRLPVRTMIASEFRIRSPHLTPRTLVIAVSQSGETIDTLMAVRRAREHGARVIALVNNEQSAIDREADGSLYTRAGIEIGVAATKTFTAQIAALGLFGLRLAQRAGTLPSERLRAELDDLSLLPGRIRETLRMERRIDRLAETFHHTSDVLFLARGVLYPVALEGALKLKEISYIHAEGYPAGEMKHGPIALIDEKTPVVVLVSRGIAYEKVLGNLEEVRARKGPVIALTDTPDDPAIGRLADHVLPVPTVGGISRPVLYTIPLQLLAYYIAVWRGTDVDQPRNLAKTVTVE